MTSCDEIGFAALLSNLVQNEYINAFFSSDIHLKSDKTGFALDIWFGTDKIPENDATLVSGGDMALNLGKNGINLIFGDKKYTLYGSSITPQLWHNIALSFSENTVSSYFDGVYTGIIQDLVDIDIQTDKWKLGENFCGYIKSFRVFTESLNQKDIADILYAEPKQNAEGKTSPSAWYVFDRDPPVEVQASRDIVLRQAAITDVSPLIHFTSDNLLEFNDNVQDGSNSYTLILRICPDLPTTDRQRIISRGEASSEDRIALYLSSENDNYVFEAEISEKKTKLQSEKVNVSDINCWHTLALTLGADGCTIWLNGKKTEYKDPFGIKSFCRKVRIGGTESETGFCGYISYLAEFNSLLSESDIQKYTKNPPFLFDANIHSLFHPVQNLSDGESLNEEISGSALDGKNGTFCIVSQTARYYATEPLSYTNNGKAFSGNDFEKWKIEFFCGLFQKFFFRSYGVSAVYGYTNENVIFDEVASRLQKYTELSAFEYFLQRAPFDFMEELQQMFSAIGKSDFLHIFTRMFYVDSYYKHNLYTMSSEFMQRLVEENSLYADAFQLFASDIKDYAMQQWKAQKPYNVGGLKVEVKSLDLDKDNKTLTAVFSYTSDKDVSAQVGVESDKTYFRCDELSEISISKTSSEATAVFPVAKLNRIPKTISASFYIEREKQTRHFLGYYSA